MPLRGACCVPGSFDVGRRNAGFVGIGHRFSRVHSGDNVCDLSSPIQQREAKGLASAGREGTCFPFNLSERRPLFCERSHCNYCPAEGGMPQHGYRSRGHFHGNAVPT